MSSPRDRYYVVLLFHYQETCSDCRDLPDCDLLTLAEAMATENDGERYSVGVVVDG